MIRAPRLPPATIVDQRSLYTRADMIEFYRLGYVAGRDSEELEEQPEQKPEKPLDPKVAELMNIMGMGGKTGSTDLGKAFGRNL